MPLRLDLYHEIARQKTLQRRDPLKLGIFAAIVVAGLCALYYFYNLNVQFGLADTRARMERQLAAYAPKVTEAKAQEDELTSAIKSSEGMEKWAEDRFYWSPVLGLLAEVVPREVQIDRLTGDVSGDLYKKGTITLAGLASGVSPRETAEKLKDAVLKKFSEKYNEVTSTFSNNALEESPLTVTLDGQPMKSVSFVITITLTTGVKPEAVKVIPKRVIPTFKK